MTSFSTGVVAPNTALVSAVIPVVRVSTLVTAVMTRVLIVVAGVDRPSSDDW